jgi:hypothetical protein
MARRRPTTLALGSYSSGTMRPEDLIPAFLSAAEDLRLSREDRQALNEIRAAFATYSEDDPDKTSDTYDPADDLDALFDLLGNYTPDYTYFGAHPGDGADYGVWIVDGLLHGRDYDGEVHKSDNLPGEDADEMRKARESSHWLHVNDHGNATLYRRAGNRWIEVWAVV